MTSGFLSGNVTRGLAFRVLLFLSLALLPIGLIAVVQTREISKQSVAAAELSLLSITEAASADYRTTLQAAFGSAQALGVMVRVMSQDANRCSDLMAAYQSGAERYELVGFIDPRGIMACSSTGNRYNFAQDAAFQAAKANPIRRASGEGQSDDAGTGGPGPNIVVMEPVSARGALLGFLSIRIPQDAFKEGKLLNPDLRPLATITFNAQGDVLTSGEDWSVAAATMPAQTDLSAHADGQRRVFRAQSVGGEERVYSVLPLVPRTVFALSVWPESTPILQTDFSSKLTGMLPVLMWLASLVVAFWALNRLALTHIRKLGRQMGRFARNRTLPRTPLGGEVPNEIVDMEQAFMGMAASILQDEAALEDSLREKNILLKEVHHRVKNNLQLISSIMNMQIRQSDNEENKRVLQRLQDRILGLATVHKNLYQETDLTRVRGGAILKEIVSQVLAIGLPPGSDVEVVQEYDDVFLQPDDAAPLTLLVSEAVTNAIKYVGKGTDADSQIKVMLKFVGEDRALLTVANTTGTQDVPSGTGLGARLITAFARQLNGNIEIDEADGSYEIRIDFPVPRENKAVRDY